MIELWLVDLEATGPALEALERDTPRLSDDDAARAALLGQAWNRRHRLTAYAALRIALERAGGPDVRRQRLVRSASGKPTLPPPAPSFSIAHTENLALIGVARTATIGVDLELPRELRMSQRRQEETLAVGEGLLAGDRTGGTAGIDVLQAWCRLEAFGKATGRGISGVLGALGLRVASGRDLPVAEIRGAARRLADAEGLEIADLGLPKGLYGAVAFAGPVETLSVRRFPADRSAIAELVSAPA
jgi:4'-phosphopantetheinyl transferase